MILLSILILARDNADRIGELIRNVNSVADEVVVVDTGSRDDTPKIAKELGANVVYKRFQDNYGELRNFGIGHAKGEWILSIDSDELLSGELIEIIPRLIRDPDIDGYWIGCKTYISKTRYLKYGLFYPDRHLRLFRNKPKYRYQGVIHEQLTIPKSKTVNVPLGIDILHFPRNPKYTAFSDFHNMYPYIRIEGEHIRKENVNRVSLVVRGISTFSWLFLGGFFRGKGFLDGWAGFRAHILFAASVAGGYFYALHLSRK